MCPFGRPFAALMPFGEGPTGFQNRVFAASAASTNVANISILGLFTEWPQETIDIAVSCGRSSDRTISICPSAN
jgi:hypothetical protein